MPEEITSQPAAAETPVPSGAVPEPQIDPAAGAAVQLTPSATPPAGTPPAATASAPPMVGDVVNQPAPAAPAWFEELRGLGVDLGQDEQAARQMVAQIYRQMAQIQPILPYANAYMQHAPAFAEFLRQQQQAAQKPAAPPSPEDPWWKPHWQTPEYDPRWQSMLRRDEQGNIVPLPGTPPDVLPKFLAWADWKQRTEQDLFQNPFKMIGEPLLSEAEKRAQKIAADTVRQHLAQVQDQQAAQSFVASSPWLYEHDAAGQPVMTMVYNPFTGAHEPQKKLSHWGARFKDYVAERVAWQQKNGIYDPDDQKQYAMMRIERDAAMARLNQSPPPSAPPTSQNGAAPQHGTAREQHNDAWLAAAPAAPRPGSNPVIAPTPINDSNIYRQFGEELLANGALEALKLNRS